MPFRILVALGFEIFAVIGTLAAPYLGFLFFVFFTILRPQDDRPNVQDLHYPMVLLFACLASTIPRMAKDMTFSFSRAVGKLSLTILYFGVMLISAIANGYTPNSAYRIHEFLVVVLTCIMFLFWGSSEIKIWGLLGAFILAGLQISRDAMTRTHWMTEEIAGQSFQRMDINRLNGNFGQPNYMALLMAVLILMCLTFLYTPYSKWLKMASVGCMGVFFWVFLRANSRGASLGLAAALIVFFLVQKRKGVTGLIFVVVAVGAVVLAPQSYFDRLATISHYENDSSATGRLELWDIGLTLIRSHPVLGVGPDNFTNYAYNTPHDSYIQAAAELGLPGAAIYCAILIGGLISSIRVFRLSKQLQDSRSLRNLAVVSLCIVVHMIVQGFTTGFSHREFLYFFIAIAHATLLVALRRVKEEAPAAGVSPPGPSLVAPRRARVLPAV